MKICSKCRCEKNFEEFQNIKKTKDNLSFNCKMCIRENKIKHYNALKEKLGAEAFSARQKAASIKYVKSRSEYNKIYKLKNKESTKAYQDEYRKANKLKAKTTLQVWSLSNKAKLRGYKHARKDTKLNATPSWANQKYMDLFFEIVKLEEDRTGRKCHLDHIVPLKSKLVCGLHCEDNMQVLFAEDNIRKGNRVWPDMFEPNEALEFYKLK